MTNHGNGDPVPVNMHCDFNRLFNHIEPAFLDSSEATRICDLFSESRQKSIISALLNPEDKRRNEVRKISSIPTEGRRRDQCHESTIATINAKLRAEGFPYRIVTGNGGDTIQLWEIDQLKRRR
jgi:hypothetical protein